MNMRTSSAIILLLLVTQLLAACAGLSRTPESLEVKLLAFNDFHGQLSPKAMGERSAGGAAVLASYFKNAQAGLEDRTFIVSAGDFVGASPPNSALLLDEPSILFLNTLANGYCAERMSPRCNIVATVGNHEFDRGVDELNRLIHGGDHPAGPFLGPHSGARFPFVAANVVDKVTGKTLLPPYVIKTVHDIPIAFIGAVLKDTPTIVAPSGVSGLTFIDEADAVNRYVPEIQARGVKAVVAILHQGGDDAKEIIRRLDGEVDVAITGHSHTYANETVANAAGNPVLVTQAYSAGTAYADITLQINRSTKDIAATSATLVSTYGDTGPGLSPDPAVAEIVAAANAAVAEVVNTVVGQAAAAITRAQTSAGESALGNLIADAQRLQTGADFAFMNPGGIRADLSEGEITWGELFTIQPFGNQMVRMSLTGQQIYDVLAQQWLNPAAPRMLQVSGLAYRWKTNDSGSGATVTEVLKDGIPIDEKSTFTVAVNSFLAEGGDGFTVFRSGANRVNGVADIDALVSHIRSLPQPFSAAVEGRIARQ